MLITNVSNSYFSQQKNDLGNWSFVGSILGLESDYTNHSICSRGWSRQLGQLANVLRLNCLLWWQQHLRPGNCRSDTSTSNTFRVRQCIPFSIVARNVSQDLGTDTIFWEDRAIGRSGDDQVMLVEDNQWGIVQASTLRFRHCHCEEEYLAVDC